MKRVELKHIAKNRYTANGLLDMQANGYMGNGYSSRTLSEASSNSLITQLASSRTAHHVPTVVTSPKKRIPDNIRMIKAFRDKDEITHKVIVGTFKSSEDGPRGAQDLNYGKDASFDGHCDRLQIHTTALGKKVLFEQ